MIEISRPKRRFLRARVTSAVAMLIVMAGCGRGDGPAIIDRSDDATLTIGYEPNAVNIQQAIGNLAVEGLLDFGRDGRPQPWLAEKWSSSDNGLVWHVWLRPNATFHDGQPVSAALVRDVLVRQLPQYLQGPFEDIHEIRAVSERELEFRLKRRSTFLLEGLEVPILKSGPSVVGTGPFQPTAGTAAGVEMLANPKYYAGKPSIDRVVFRPYPSLRAAWADMLRGHVDMLYEVGVDALDSLERSSAINVFTFARSYVYAVVLNVRREPFQNSAFRRGLNAAMDRETLVSDVLGGHATPADGPISPFNWARNSKWQGFVYAPQSLANEARSIRPTCIFGDPSLERMALTVQRQLESVGIELALESVSGEVLLARLESGDFDCALADIGSGPNLVRPYWFWHSKGPFNWGGFRNKKVDAALDSVRHAENDDDYKAGVAAFHRAIVEDPPAIFIAWSERSRAVSTRFDVAFEPGRDILSDLRLWRPVADARMANRN